MAPSEPSGPSVSAHSGRPTRAPDSRAIASSTSGLTELSGKIALTRSRRIVVDQRGDLAGRGLRGGRARGDHGADDADAVAAGVVAERVVCRHQRALGAGDLRDAVRDRCVEPFEPLGVLPCGAPVSLRAGRIGLRQRVAQARDGCDRVARVLPPVGVIVCELDGIGEHEHRRVGAGAVDRALEPLVERAARAHDELGVAQLLDVVGADLERMRIGVGGEQSGHLHPLASDRAGEVGGLPGRGDDAQPRAAAGLLLAACGEAQAQEQQGENGAHALAPYCKPFSFALRSDPMAADAHSNWGAHARSELARTGHRAGGAREQVLALLERQHCCLSAQEIHDRLRADSGRTPGLASVYRALEVLTSLRLVHRLDVDGSACFEPADPSGEHHHHAICERCGKRRCVRRSGARAADRRRRRALGLRHRRARRRAARPLPRLRVGARSGEPRQPSPPARGARRIEPFGEASCCRSQWLV